MTGVEIITLNYAKITMKVISSIFLLHCKDGTFQHKGKACALFWVRKITSWVTGRNKELVNFSDASCTATAHICGSSADETWHQHLKRLAIFTCEDSFLLCNFDHLDTASLLYFILWNISFHEFPGNHVSLFCLTEADKVIYCILPTGWALPSNSFGSGRDHSSPILLFLSSVICNLSRK